MNEGDYFVMLFYPTYYYGPLMFNDYHIAKFKTAEAAKKSAEDNPIGSNCGFVVFNINDGIE